jgi:SAM-dependent methyltransferase
LPGGRRGIRLKTFNGTIEELQDEGRKFDVVVSIATIEHVFDPASYLATIRSVLKEGGVLYMTMPRLGHLSRLISTSAIYDVFPPLHLNFFDARSMKAIIQAHDIAFSINEAFQSHGPVFHLGHAFANTITSSKISSSRRNMRRLAASIRTATIRV